ncbi:MAG: hypothetical protein OEM41_09415, partial [Ignavibacteria bacterium]|nr:hypothetical protein [Ignavibacteria bacterium]
RKGSPGEALEVLSEDSAVVTRQIPNYYRFGSGSVTTAPISIPLKWHRLRWQWTGPSGTAVQFAVIGVRGNGSLDTLSVLPEYQSDVDLGFLAALTSDTTYTAIRFSSLLSSTDPLITPVLREWSVDLSPPGDLAVSARSIGPANAPSLRKGDTFELPVNIYNIGYQGIDSANVIVSLFDRFNKARPIAFAGVDTIAPGSAKAVTIPLSTKEFPRHVTLEVAVSPSEGGKDLVPENNFAYYTFDVTSSIAKSVQVFADGVRLMDGDYIPPDPHLLVRIPNSGFSTQRRVELLVNGKQGGNEAAASVLKSHHVVGGSAAGDMEFTPTLADGSHELQFRVIEASPFGGIDTLRTSYVVNVLSEMRILQPLNYPNPFRQETYFTFVLTGANVPEELRISVYTVTGRKIRELTIQGGALQVGFNKIYWDGRDDDGDEIANGYYFYKILVRGGGKTETALEKLAKIR